MVRSAPLSSAKYLLPEAEHLDGQLREGLNWGVLGFDSREISRVLFGVKEELGILEEAYGPRISMTSPTFSRLCPLDTCASFYRKLRAVL